MKTRHIVLFIVSAFIFVSTHLQAQVPPADTTIKDTTVTSMDTTVTDTTGTATTTVTDTTVAPATTTAAPAETTETAAPKQKSTLIVYAGPNISTLRVESEEFDKESKTGFHIGLSWRKKGFVYTQLGVRYNSPVYSIIPKGRSDSGDHKFSVSDIDLPLLIGVNFLSGRIVGLRGFLGAVPTFNISVGDNDEGFEKENINTFIFYGQAGLGIDVAFLSIDIGYNYGFSDLLKSYNSKPGQGFVNIGFRF